MHSPAQYGRRRTPALTKRCRELFEAEIAAVGWQPGGTIPAIAREMGLTREQVRDAIFAESADTWRQELTDRLSHQSR